MRSVIYCTGRARFTIVNQSGQQKYIGFCYSVGHVVAELLLIPRTADVVRPVIGGPLSPLKVHLSPGGLDWPVA